MATPRCFPLWLPDLVARKVDLIFAVSSTALQAAREASTTIPILSIDLETDPIGSGFAKSTAQPGGNITGIFLDFPDFGKKWLEVLKKRRFLKFPPSPYFGIRRPLEPN